MTISPSRSWIWQNEHCISIRNASKRRDRSDFVENGSEIGWTGQNTKSGRRAVRWGWTGNILRNILSARLRLSSGSAWHGNILGNILLARLEARLWSRLSGSARLEYGARVSQSSSTSGRVVCAWSNSAESSGCTCGLPPSPIKLICAPVSSYGWGLHCGMIKTCFWQLWKFGYRPKHFCFLTNRALIPIVGGRNHWWWLWNTQRV